MKSEQKSPGSIDEYIAGFPVDVQETLQKIRDLIREVAPGAQETIKYAMPTFTLKGNLVHFAAYQRHISIYPAPEGDERFNQELAPYRTEKSTLRFPLNKPIPYDLIRRIVEHLIEENLLRATPEAKRKSI